MDEIGLIEAQRDDWCCWSVVHERKCRVRLQRREDFVLFCFDGNLKTFILLPFSSLRCPVESRDVIIDVEKERHFCVIKSHELLDIIE